jgi:3-hydroxymyristoyl/3-hydroxydecanoyl-(acyl carrier protein) dehydratase
MNTVTALQIAADHPAFAGHFPGLPIVPGVVLLDAALFTIAAALQLQLDCCTLSTVKFRSVARPGQALSLRFDSPSPAPGKVRFAIESAGQTVAEGVVSLPAPATSVHDR